MKGDKGRKRVGEKKEGIRGEIVKNDDVDKQIKKWWKGRGREGGRRAHREKVEKRKELKK